MIKKILLVALCVLIVGCSSDNEITGNVVGVDTEPEIEISTTGVQVGDKIAVNYIGWTSDGGIFDSSIVNWQGIADFTGNSRFSEHDSRDLAFVVGQGNLIPGFEEGVIGMEEGEVKVLEISPEKGYGTDASSHPLGGKDLIFKVKVVRID